MLHRRNLLPRLLLIGGAMGALAACAGTTPVTVATHVNTVVAAFAAVVPILQREPAVPAPVIAQLQNEVLTMHTAAAQIAASPSVDAALVQTFLTSVQVAGDIAVSVPGVPASAVLVIEGVQILLPIIAADAGLGAPAPLQVPPAAVPAATPALAKA